MPALQIVVVALVVASAAAQTTCEVNNDCYSTKKKYCYFDPDEPTAEEGVCVQCVSDAACGPNEYCLLDRETEREPHKCYGYESSIIGSRCDPDVTTPVLGSSDKMFCGLATYNLDNTVRNFVWRGSCHRRQCRICDEGQVENNNARICANGEFIVERNFVNKNFDTIEYSPNAILIITAFPVLFLSLMMTCFLAIKSIRDGGTPERALQRKSSTKLNDM